MDTFVNSAPGYPNLGSSGVTDYTKQLYAAKLLIKFYLSCTYADIANRDYEGEISNLGDKVKIRTVPDVTVQPYTRGMDIAAARQYLEPPSVDLTIDKANFYSAAIDEVDKKQNDIDMLGEADKDASQKMAIAIDRDVLNTIPADAGVYNFGPNAGKISGKYNMGITGAPVSLNQSNILNYIVYANSVLAENDVPPSDRFIIIPEIAKSLINTSDLRSALFTGDASNQNLRNGKMGMISDFTIYSSNNLLPVTDGGLQCFNLVFGQKSALTFATQLVKNRRIELQNTFGWAQEGLQVYGYQAVKPQALGNLYATFPVTLS